MERPALHAWLAEAAELTSSFPPDERGVLHHRLILERDLSVEVRHRWIFDVDFVVLAAVSPGAAPPEILIPRRQFAALLGALSAFAGYLGCR
jgi:hypothetical protein